jgi:DNA recombination protein RmuC
MIVGLVLVALVLVLLAAGGMLLLRLLRAELAAQRQETRNELTARNSEINKRLEGLDGRLLSTQQSAGQTATQIVEKIGELGRTSAQMLQRANDLARLEQALRPPKARGGVGELLLANVLRDSLPADAYELEHTFRTGERVDAVVRADKLVPIDAKFPLENFERVVNASDDAERELYEKAFARDVKIHVDAIATKYVRPAEGTFDFALMYLPSESIYYELVCGKTGGLYSYALGKRVFPVSPSTFHAYLAIIVLGLRGLQIERHAQDVMAYCAQLAKDFGRFRDDFNVVGKHIGNAQTKFGESDRRLERLETRLEQATEPTALEDPAPDPASAEPELPRALDAA